MKAPRLTDPSFRYYRAVETDLRRTFARVRKQLREEEEKVAQQVRKLPVRKTA